MGGQTESKFFGSGNERSFSLRTRGNSVHNKVSSNLSGSGYDLALSLFGENFFDGFSKTSSEEQLWNDLRPYLTMDLTLKARAESERVEVDGSYRYREPVLNPDFGLKVAAKLEKIRGGEDSLALNGVYGEFVEVFFNDWIMDRWSPSWKEWILPNQGALMDFAPWNLEHVSKASRRV